MKFLKKPEGVLLTKNQNLELFTVGLNGFILVHKNLNIIAFTNSLKDNISFLEGNDSFMKYFLNENDYVLSIVKDKKIIFEPSNEDIMELEKNRHQVLYSRVTKALMGEGYIHTRNITDVLE